VIISLHCALNHPCLCVCSSVGLWVRLITASAQRLRRLWAFFLLSYLFGNIM